MVTPGRSTAIIFVICVLAVGGAALYTYGAPGSSQTETPKQMALLSVDQINNTIGTSTDWRAQFGYSTTSPITQKQTGKTPNSPSTVTETLGIDLMSHLADLKQANLIGNTDIVNQTVDNMLTRDIDPVKPQTYSSTDLRVITSSDHASLATFATALSNLINSYSAAGGELATLQEYVTNSDASVLVKLDPSIKEQKRMLAGLVSIPVPQSFLKNELDLINGMSALEGASESLRVADSDAIRGLLGSSLHADAAYQITDALSAMNTDFGSNGVAFGLHWEILNTLLN